MGDVLNRGSKDRPRWYRRYVDTDGKRKQRATHQPSRALAQRFLAEVEARIRRGDLGIPEPTPEERGRKSVTVRELSERFLGEVDGEPGHAPPRIKNIDRYRRDARSCFKARINPVLGEMSAASVTAIDVERMRDAQLARKLSPESVVHSLAITSKLYNWARRAGHPSSCASCGSGRSDARRRRRGSCSR